MKLTAYVDELINQFYLNLKKAIGNADFKAIHDLRVALKKLFVLHRVIELYFPELSKSYHKSYKKIQYIFKQTGIIRDNQITNKLALQWLSEDNSIKFSEFTTPNIHQGKMQLHMLYADFDIEEARKEFNRSFYHISSAYSIDFRNYLLVFIEDNGKKILKSVQSKKCDYHAVRRWVKEQYYIQMHLEKVFGLDINRDILNKKNKIGKSLGEWHDLKVFEKQLIASGIEINISILSALITSQNSILEDIKFYEVEKKNTQL